MLAAGQVIEAVADSIRTVPAFASKVFTDRFWPLTVAELPAWRVYADDEEIDPTGPTFPALQKHELMVHCEGTTRAVEGLDAEMNDLAKDGLAVLFASKAAASLSPLNCSMSLARIERTPTTEGEAAVGRITLALRVRFNTRNNDPETIV